MLAIYTHVGIKTLLKITANEQGHEKHNQHSHKNKQRKTKKLFTFFCSLCDSVSIFRDSRCRYNCASKSLGGYTLRFRQIKDLHFGKYLACL